VKKYIVLIAFACGMALLPGCCDKQKLQKGQRQIHKKRLVNKAEKAVAYVEKHWSLELDLAEQRMSRADLRGALKDRITNRQVSGMGYKIAEYMMGVNTQDAPYIFYKMDLDKEESNLKKLKKQLKKHGVEHPMIEQLKRYTQNLHEINMAICHSKEFLTEAYINFAKDK